MQMNTNNNKKKKFYEFTIKPRGDSNVSLRH